MSPREKAVQAMVVATGSPTQQQTEITGLVTSSTSILVKYKTLPGNLPNQNGNVMAVWQDTQIPWGTPPLQKKTVTGNQPTGSDAFDNLGIQSKSYIVGYSTGSNLSTVCSTLTFTPGNVQGTPFLTSLGVKELDTDTLIVSYDTPVGNDPKANQNWIGLWEGKSFTWDGKNRLTKINVDKNSATGSMVMLYSLKIDTFYTLAYASGAADTNISTSLTFQTGPFLK
jgi:hypothetical protein